MFNTLRYYSKHAYLCKGVSKILKSPLNKNIDCAPILGEGESMESLLYSWLNDEEV